MRILQRQHTTTTTTWPKDREKMTKGPVPTAKKSPSFGARLFTRRTSSSSTLVESNPWGITKLYDPCDARVDIVFVHGIKGHPENTWGQGEGGPPWPRTLLPTRIPEARILTFGYDANPIAFRLSVSGNRIGDHSKNLLAALAAHRVDEKTSNRPIIFVAHSLGGLVCKDALLTSRSSPEERLKKIFECTSGILFLGTPHSGASLATVAQRLVPVLGLFTSKPNLRIVKVLQRDSEVLARIQDDFYALLQSRNKGRTRLEVTCFYEELPYPGIGNVIVSNESAVLRGYTGVGIHAHHRDMVRFASENSPGFESIVAELRRFVNGLHVPGQGGPDSEKGVDIRNSPDKDTGRQENNYDGITIWGEITKSNIVNGNQIIDGDLTFS
ncbi:sesB-related regulatory protein [Podospora didyma]|uniref:SesB-related regulatory protein n=1 Tax=Podospora didyma TaxID=330526 RepID=A0AAE0U1F6_9PEZI|nr:sesB-related regulatory protein [Podospora didyma]